VSVAETLIGLGLSLRQAHAILNRLAADEEVVTTLPNVVDGAATAATLQGLGVRAEWRRPPEQVDVKAIRERLSLTQAAFAARFGLELDSVRNWEQGRYAPDPIARTLLKVIEQSPEAVDKAVAA
jgi:DNA-binding XRE family transcriptional regulator